LIRGGLLGKTGISIQARKKDQRESLINAFKRESQRQRLMVKKARLCEAKLVIIVTAFSKLLAD